MNIRELFDQAEPYMKTIDRYVYHERHRGKELFAKARWREFAVPHLVEIYTPAAKSADLISSSFDVRIAEIGYLAALGSGIDSVRWADDLIEVISSEVEVEKLCQESAVALAGYVCTIRLLGQLAQADSIECLGCFCSQIDDSEPLSSLALLYHYEADALGSPAETTQAAVEHLCAAGEDRFNEGPALILLRWAHATGFLREHAAEIQAALDARRAESEAFAARFDDLGFAGLLAGVGGE